MALYQQDDSNRMTLYPYDPLIMHLQWFTDTRRKLQALCLLEMLYHCLPKKSRLPFHEGLQCCLNCFPVLLNCRAIYSRYTTGFFPFISAMLQWYTDARQKLQGGLKQFLATAGKEAGALVELCDKVQVRMCDKKACLHA
jgi:hypothetical protein